MSLFGGIELPDRPDPANIARLDRLPIPMISAMCRYGMRIDVDHFKSLAVKLSGRMHELRQDITNEIPPDQLERFLDLDDELDTDSSDLEQVDEPVQFHVESGEKIAALLYDVLHLDESGVKIKRTKKGALSTGKKSLEQLKRAHPIVPLILEYRENAKLLGTYALSMPRRARLHLRGSDCRICGRSHYMDEYRVHTEILTTRTATGRTASKNPNLANIPARTKLGAEIRAGFIPSEGHVIAQRDFAQIELRLMADRSGDPVMTEVYQADGDIHMETAMRTFGITDPIRVDKMLHRAPSKNTNFAVAYLISGQGLLDLMAVTFATANKPLPDYMDVIWCEQFIEKWFGVYQGVRSYLDQEESKARRYAMVWTAAGRVRRIPEVRSCHRWIQEAGVRQGCNHGIQGYSGDLMKLAAGELSERFQVLKEYGILTYPLQTIYDELLVETPEDNADAVEEAMGDVMDNCLVDKQTGRLMCRVPIKSDGKILKRWTKE